jgi:hypothetical protein
MGNKIKALSIFMGVDPADIEIDPQDTSEFIVGNARYLVFTDSEANDYIKDCVMEDIPYYLESYFDLERWTRAVKIDGRGHWISYYNGEEHPVCVDDNQLFIYRVV